MGKSRWWKKIRNFRIERKKLEGQELYVALLGRLCDLCFSRDFAAQLNKEITRDQWGLTVAKAFTLRHEGKDYNAFLRHHVFEKTPYGDEEKLDNAIVF